MYPTNRAIQLLAGYNNKERILKRTVTKPTAFVLFALLAAVVTHIGARVLAGVYNVAYPWVDSETTNSSLFWSGFWNFYPTSEWFPEHLRFGLVLMPHIAAATVVLAASMIVIGARYGKTATPRQQRIFWGVLPVYALTISILALINSIIVANAPL